MTQGDARTVPLDAEGSRHGIPAPWDALVAVLDPFSEGVVLMSAQGALLHANAAAVEVLGFPDRATLLRQPPADLLPPDGLADEEGRPLAPAQLPGPMALRGVEASERSIRLRHRVTGETRWLHLRASPLRDGAGRIAGAVTFYRDVTQERQARERDALLADAGALLGATLDVDEVLAGLARLCVPRLADACAVDLVEREGIRLAELVHVDADRAELLREMRRAYPLRDDDPGVPEVARTGQTRLMPRAAPESLVAMARDARHLELLRATAARWALIVPLRAGHTILGTWTLLRDGADAPRPGPTDVALAEELGRRVGLAIEKARAHSDARDRLGFLAELVDGVDGIVWEADATTHQFTFVSGRAHEMLGYPVEAWLGSPTFWAERLHPQDRARVVTERRRHAAEGREHEMEYRLVAADGRVLWVHEAAHVVRDAEGKPHRLRGVMQDATARRRTESRLRAQNALATALAKGESIAQAVPAILASIGENLGWELGVLWRREPDGALHCEGTWHAAGVEGGAFEADTRGRRFAQGEGLPGRVARSGEAVWLSDFTEERAFPRVRAALAQGLHAAIGIPVGSRAEYGVLEFFSRERRDPDPDLLQVACNLGVQVAQFLERAEVEAELRASQARRGAILDASLDAVVTIDARGNVTEWNAAAERILGWSREETLGLEMAQLIVPPELRDVHRRGLARFVATGKANVMGQRLELPVLRRDGSRFLAELAIVEIPGQSERTFTGFIRDISDRKDAEQTLRFQQSVLRAQMEAVLDGIIVLDAVGNIVMANGQFSRLWSIPPEEIVSGKAAALRARMLEQVADPDGFLVKFDGEDAPPDERVRDEVTLRDGRILERYGATVRGGDGTRYGRVWTFRDITERKRGEEKMAQLLGQISDQRKRLDNIVGSVPGVVWEAWGSPDATEQRIDFVSSHVERMLGYTVEEWLATPNFWLTIVHPDDRERAARESAAIFLSGKSGEVRFRWVAKDGTVLWVQAHSVSVLDADGHPVAMRGVTLDVSERVRAENALRLSDERFHLLARATNDTIWDWDLRTGALWWNANFESMFGHANKDLEPGIESWTNRIHPDDLARVKDEIHHAIEGDALTWSDEYRFRRQDGSYATVLDRGIIVRDADGKARRMIGSMMDVSERKKAEEALRESEARYRFLAENSNDLIIRSDLEGRYRYVSPASRAILGYAPEELLGVTGRALVHPDDLERLAPVRDEVAQRPHASIVTFRMRRKGGGHVWVEAAAQAVRDDATGVVTGYVAAIRDVTERKRAEEELEARAEALEAATRELTHQGRLLSWQHRVLESIVRGAPLAETLEILCRDAQRYRGDRMYSVLLLDDDGRRLRHGAGPSLPDTYNAAIDGLVVGPGVGSCGTAAFTKEPVIVEDIATHPSWAAFRELALPVGLRACWSTPILGSDGALLGTWAIYSREPGAPGEDDQTIIQAATRLASIAIERARTENALLDQMALMKAITENAASALFMMDASGHPVFMNPAAAEMTGYAGIEEIRGRPLHDAVHFRKPDGSSYPMEECPIDQANAEVVPLRNQRETFCRKDGALFPIEYNVAPLGRHGKSRGAVIEVRDITERLRAESELKARAEELARLAEQLERSNKELDQFAYVTSHDLKAPLRGIANLSRWIEEDLGSALTSESRGHLDLLRGRVHRMEALIDAILEYSRVGRAHGADERVDVREMLDDVKDLLAPPEGFQILVEGDMPTLETEKTRLQQVFLNLIGNAIKHHPEPAKGVVRVSIEDAGDRWRFRVADNGRGISPRFHEKIFVIFQTLEARDKVEGTGIGLALVKKIVESHGGRVTLVSEEGKGATFTFTWPKT